MPSSTSSQLKRATSMEVGTSSSSSSSQSASLHRSSSMGVDTSIIPIPNPLKSSQKSDKSSLVQQGMPRKDGDGSRTKPWIRKRKNIIALMGLGTFLALIYQFLSIGSIFDDSLLIFQTDADQNITINSQREIGAYDMVVNYLNSSLNQASNNLSQSTNSTLHPQLIGTNGSTAYDVFARSNYSDKKFNYTAFWQKALKKAKSVEPEYQKPRQFNLTTCPKVFVYNLSDDLTEGGRNYDLITAFGRPEGPMYNTRQNSLARLVEYRLVTSQHCITTNASEADLFFVPIFPNGHGISQWSQVCKDFAGIMKSLLPQLVHLTMKTSCQHFFVVGKGHYAASKCRGWWRKPVYRLRQSLRVAYTDVHYKIDKKLPQYYRDHGGTDEFPNLISVPYPSAMHWERNKGAPWEDPEVKEQYQRSSLMLFVGSARHGDLPVRSRVHGQCLKYNDTRKCNLNVNNNKKGKTTGLKLDEKLRATFCLEPGGDTPDRKSIADSIAAGCIPVLFNDITGTGWKWFWEKWKARAHVLVPRKYFIRNKIDLWTLLHSSMPPEMLQILQETLSAKAREFQYSLDEDPNDGMRVMLEGLKQTSQKQMENGVCVGLGQNTA